MSGTTASQALQDRFEAIRRAELERLARKLCGLSEADRCVVDQITTHIMDALTQGPEEVLAQNGHAPSIVVEALVRVFALEA